MATAAFNLYWESFLRLIFPAHCAVCSHFLELEEKTLCRLCLEQLKRIRFSYPDSLLETPFHPIKNTWSLFSYKTPFREILMGIKYFGKRWAIKIFSEEVKDIAISIASETTYDGLVPIPLSRHKLLERKYNQSELIAELFSAWTSIPTYRNILKRSGLRPSQSQLSFEERQINPKGAFLVNHPKSIRNKTLLLIDDIVTTGATAREAAEMLKAAGAKRVDLFTLAHTERT